MIPDKHAELLNLPPATSVEEAQRHCQQLLERLRQNIEALPPAHQIHPELDSRKTELEQASAFFEAQSQSALEETLDRGMACVMQKPPDYAGAGKFYAAAERAAAGKTIPALLQRRMQVFKQTLDEGKAQTLRGNVSATLKRIATLLAQEPPGITEAREKLGLVALALRQSPDPAFLADFENLRKAFQEREKRLAHARVEAPRPAPVEIPASAPQPARDAADQVTTEMPSLRGQQPPALKTAPKVPEPLETVAGNDEMAIPENAVPPVPSSPPEVPEETPADTAVPAVEKPELPTPPTSPQAPHLEAIEPSSKSKKPLPMLAGMVILIFLGMGYAGWLKIKSARQAATADQTPQQVARETFASAAAPPPTNVVTPLPVTNPAAAAPVPQSITKPAPPPPEFGELTITVEPEGADLSTNGVSLGHPHYPVVLKGVSQSEVSFRASLEGYTSDSITLVFPSHGAQMRQTFELQPKLAMLLIKSEPAAAEISLQRPGGKAVKVKVPREGIGFTPGVPVNITVELPGYEAATVQVPALKPGERHEVAFGKLKPQGGGLRVKATPSTNITTGSLHPASAPAPVKTSPADVDQALRDTAAGIDTVKARLPLTDVSRRKWVDWIKQIESRFKDDARAWARLNGPIGQLRELVNTTTPIQRVPALGHPRDL